MNFFSVHYLEEVKPKGDVSINNIMSHKYSLKKHLLQILYRVLCLPLRVMYFTNLNSKMQILRGWGNGCYNHKSDFQNRAYPLWNTCAVFLK